MNLKPGPIIQAYVGPLCIVFAAWIGTSGQLEAQCPALTSSVANKLVSYVEKEYQLAPDITVEDDGIIGPSCFRKVTFNSQAPRRTIALYLSPDQRFLSRELLDTSLDPDIQRQRVSEETLMTLLSDHSPSRGSNRTGVTIVEFSDFECPFCRRFSQYLSSAEGPGNREVQVVFKHMPLSMHPWARQAAVTAACASLQGQKQFWNMHDLLFLNQDKFTIQDFNQQLAALAKNDSTLNIEALHDCLKDGSGELTVQRDLRLAERYHITATPTIFINGVRMLPFRTAEDLQGAIDQAIVNRKRRENSSAADPIP